MGLAAGKDVAMEQVKQKIGFIGAGNMGAALISAVIQSQLVRPDDVYAFDVDPDRCEAVAGQTGINLLKSSTELISLCDMVVLAVKPQQMTAVLNEIAQFVSSVLKVRKLLVSIAAGYPIRKMESILYMHIDERQAGNLPIIRVMPNTPALVRAGVSGMSANRYASAGDMKVARLLLQAAGGVLEFEENMLDAVTALSGSGPAYVFYLIEAMIEAGTTLGLAPDEAVTLTVSTFNGALQLLRQTGDTPEQLRQKVTSPGGTTEAALKVLKARGFKPAVAEAIASAASRAAELSSQC